MSDDNFKAALLAAFKEEAASLLSQIESELQQPWTSETAHDIFRHFHSLKGSAQLLEFHQAASAAQLGEALARTHRAEASAEVHAIHRYLKNWLANLLENKKIELEPYPEATAQAMLQKIAAQQEIEKKEQTALFKLFAKNIQHLGNDSQQSVSTSLLPLQRAAQLMEITDIEQYIAELLASESDRSIITANLLNKLQQHHQFNDAFIQFYQQAKA